MDGAENNKTMANPPLFIKPADRDLRGRRKAAADLALAHGKEPHCPLPVPAPGRGQRPASG